MIHDQPLESEDPTIICQIDFANAFQTPNRQLGTNDCILGIASRTYDQGRVKIGHALPHLKALKNFFREVETASPTTRGQRTISQGPEAASKVTLSR
jgi:hypothetical protein